MNNIYKKSPFAHTISNSILFYRSINERFKSKSDRFSDKYYTSEYSKKIKSEKMVVMMVDGRHPHGGLTDRLRGCLSVFQLCKELNIPFHINFDYPFNLSQYLLPNRYDWSIFKESINYHNVYSKPIIVDCLDAIGESIFDRHILKKSIANKDGIQFHVYTNAHFGEHLFARSFHELFKPSPLLHEAIDINKHLIGKKYESATFRFQQLLGDFKEGDPSIYKVLANPEREKLIRKCKDKLYWYLDSIPDENKLLVTSDSITFLNEVARNDRIYIIPGNIAHMNYSTDNDKVFLKSFIDLFMLMEAEKIALFQTDDMYNSGFPRFAGLLGNKPSKHYKF